MDDLPFRVDLELVSGRLVAIGLAGQDARTLSMEVEGFVEEDREREIGRHVWQRSCNRHLSSYRLNRYVDVHHSADLRRPRATSIHKHRGFNRTLRRMDDKTAGAP